MLDRTSPVTAVPANLTAARRASGTKAVFSLPRPKHDLPATPPPEVLAALDRAARVAAELHRRRLDVHFEQTATGSVTAQVVDAGGGVVREIPVARALDLLSGDGPVTIFDELARP